MIQLVEIKILFFAVPVLTMLAINLPQASNNILHEMLRAFLDISGVIHLTFILLILTQTMEILTVHIIRTGLFVQATNQ